VPSPGGAIGRAVLCWLEGFWPKDSRLVSPTRFHLFQLVEEGFIF
jgi:hypothetical protein